MLEAIGLTAFKAVGFVSLGACLGVGFWLSRKATNKLDEFLALRDKKLVEETVKDLNVQPVVATPTPAMAPC